MARKYGDTQTVKTGKKINHLNFSQLRKAIQKCVDANDQNSNHFHRLMIRYEALLQILENGNTRDRAEAKTQRKKLGKILFP